MCHYWFPDNLMTRTLKNGFSLLAIQKRKLSSTSTAPEEIGATHKEVCKAKFNMLVFSGRQSQEPITYNLVHWNCHGNSHLWSVIKINNKYEFWADSSQLEQWIWITSHSGRVRCGLRFVALVCLHYVEQNQNIKPKLPQTLGLFLIYVWI